MYRVVFFIELTEDKWSLGPKIWRHYLNWFSMHEDAAFEMGEIHYLKPSHRPGAIDVRHEKLQHGSCFGTKL